MPSSVVDSESLDIWSKDLSRFWISPESKINPRNGELASFYDSTKQIEGGRGLDTIRGRFQKLFYYDLLYLINPSAAGDKADFKVYTQLANLIVSQSRVTYDHAIVLSDLISGVRAGRRYHKLTVSFGTAILFVIPDSYSLDLWVGTIFLFVVIN